MGFVGCGVEVRFWEGIECGGVGCVGLVLVFVSFFVSFGFMCVVFFVDVWSYCKRCELVGVCLSFGSFF